MEVTFDLGWLIGAVFVPIGFLLVKRINAVDKKATKDNVAIVSALADYKLVAERRFASVGHLQEVESRLEEVMKTLSGDVKELTRSIDRLTAKSELGA